MKEHNIFFVIIKNIGSSCAKEIVKVYQFTYMKMYYYYQPRSSFENLDFCILSYFHMVLSAIFNY